MRNIVISTIVALVIFAGPAAATPLHEAARTGDVTTLRSLLAAGADPNARTQRQITALHLSAFRGDATAIDTLIKGDDHRGCAIALGVGELVLDEGALLGVTPDRIVRRESSGPSLVPDPAVEIRYAKRRAMGARLVGDAIEQKVRPQRRADEVNVVDDDRVAVEQRDAEAAALLGNLLQRAIPAGGAPLAAMSSRATTTIETAASRARRRAATGSRRPHVRTRCIGTCVTRTGMAS